MCDSGIEADEICCEGCGCLDLPCFDDEVDCIDLMIKGGLCVKETGDEVGSQFCCCKSVGFVRNSMKARFLSVLEALGFLFTIADVVMEGLSLHEALTTPSIDGAAVEPSYASTWLAFYVIFAVVSIPMEGLLIWYLHFGISPLLNKVFMCKIRKGNAVAPEPDVEANETRSDCSGVSPSGRAATAEAWTDESTQLLCAGAKSMSHRNKEIIIQMMLTMKSIFIMGMAYGQLVFAISSYGNYRLFQGNLNLTTTVFLFITTMIGYLIMYFHMYRAMVKSQSHSLRLFFHLVEFLLAGFSLTSSAMSLTIAYGGGLALSGSPGQLFGSIILWSIIGYIIALLLLTSRGRTILLWVAIIILFILSIFCGGDKKRENDDD